MIGLGTRVASKDTELVLRKPPHYRKPPRQVALKLSQHRNLSFVESDIKSTICIRFILLQMQQFSMVE